MDIFRILIRGQYSIIKDVSYKRGHRAFQVNIEGELVEVYLFSYIFIAEVT